MEMTFCRLVFAGFMIYVIMMQSNLAAKLKEGECPSRDVQQELHSCIKNTTDNIVHQNTNPLCLYGEEPHRYNLCVCRALAVSLDCFVELWSKCSKDPALSGLGWTYGQYLDNMFFSQVGKRCPRSWFVVPDLR